MGHATAAFAQAIFFTTAVSGVDRFVDRHDDVCDSDVGRFATQGITAAWATCGFDEFMAAKLAKQLL